jgi:DedD protein
VIARNPDILLDDATRAQRTRRTHLYRAALAFTLMCLLLVGLLLVDDADTGASPPGWGTAAPAAPIATPSVSVDGGNSLLERETAAAPVDRESPPEAGTTLPAVPETLTTSAPVAVEPVRVVEAPVAPVAAPVVADALEVAPTVTPAPPVKTDPVVSKAATVKETPVAPDGFRVQLGQFEAMREASALRDRLLRQGYAAGLQIRVGVGPYDQRKAAEAALARMRRERGMGGLVVALPSGKGLIVQLGVFAEQRNADELAARIKGWGYATQLHARVLIGPYPDQQSAQVALQQLQRERLEGVVIKPAS